MGDLDILFSDSYTVDLKENQTQKIPLPQNENDMLTYDGIEMVSKRFFSFPSSRLCI